MTIVQVWVTYQDEQVLMRVVDGYISLDRRTAGKADRLGFRRTEEPGWERVRDIALADVASIEIDAIQGASEHFKYRVTTGFLGSNVKTPAITGVLIVTKTGDHVLLQIPYKAPIQVRAELGPLMAQVNG